MSAGRVELDAEQEVGRDQDALERQADAVLEPVALLLGLVVELQEAVDLLGPDRAAEGAAGEPGDDLAGGLAGRQVGPVGHDPPVGLGQHRRRAGCTGRRATMLRTISTR